MGARLKTFLVMLPAFAFGAWVFLFAPREDVRSLLGWFFVAFGASFLVCHRWMAETTSRYEHLRGTSKRWHALAYAAAGASFVLWGMLVVFGIIRIGK